MGYILNIESSTKNCSVSISKEGKNIALIEENFDQYAHSEKLLVFVDEALKQANISRSDLSAVAISKGPGSYTGLRIGVSLSKGLCYALDIPLISVPSTEVLAYTFLNDKELNETDVICSTIDARRMEVYTNTHDSSGKALSNIEAKIVVADFMSEYSAQKVYFIGDSVQKIADVVDHSNFEAIELFPSALGLEKVSYQKYKMNDFEDVAYFEPYYLKEFLAGK